MRRKQGLLSGPMKPHGLVHIWALTPSGLERNYKGMNEKLLAQA